MREYVIEQVRKNARVRGKQRTWISELTDEQIYELFLRLRTGENAKSIARYIQKALEVLPESTPHSVSQGVLKFKRRIAHLLVNRSPGDITPIISDSEGIDKLEGPEGVERIAQLQLERIHRMMMEERETGIRQTGMSREIHSLSALLKTLIKAKEWDMVHEGMDPVKRRRFEEERRRLAGRFTELMDTLGDDGRNRMIEVLNRFLEKLEERSRIMTIGPDGKYHIVKPDEDSQEVQTRESFSRERVETKGEFHEI